MTDTIDARTQAREEALRQALEFQRRMAKPSDYVYDKQQNSFWDLMDGSLHEAEAVDASIPKEYWRVVVQEPPEREEGARGRPAKRKETLVKPSIDIQRVENDQFCEAATWWPGREQLIRGWFVDSGGFFESPGRVLYNQYKPPPNFKNGRAEAAQPWIDHVKKLWPEPEEHEFFFDYCAHMIQRPDEKCNAGVVLSGAQRIGKDAALLPVNKACGVWNVKSIDPDKLFKTDTPWMQCVMLIVNEAKPAKDDFQATDLYNILKPLMAAPPETLPLRDLYTKLRYVRNVMRVFITTNDPMGMYVPPEDGRVFMMHSRLQSHWHLKEGKERYFIDLFKWIEEEGKAHVSAWLKARDLSAFNPQGEVKKTAGWDSVAGTWEQPDDGVTQAVERLGKPDVMFGAEMMDESFDFRDEVAGLLKHPRKVAFRMQQAGYRIVKSTSGDRWQFKHEGAEKAFRSRLAFVRIDLSKTDAEIVTAIKARGAEMAEKLSRKKELF